MAFPFGQREDITPAIAKQLPEYGYDCCFSNFGGENFSPAHPYDLYRIDLGGEHHTLVWKALVHGINIGRWRGWWDLLIGLGRPRLAPTTAAANR